MCCEYLSVRWCIWLYVISMSRTRFRVNLHSLPECQGTPCSKQTRHLKFKWQQWDSNPQPLSLQTNTKRFCQTGRMIKLCCEYLSVRSIWLHVVYHVRYAFQSEFTLYSCLNVEELFPRKTCDIWSLSANSEIRTHNQLVRKRTLNHLAKLAKWLSCVVSIYHACFEQGVPWHSGNYGV